VKLRLVLPALLAALVALFAVGCGGGDDEGGAGADPASIAPAGTSLYLDFVLRPKGEMKTNIEGLAQKIAGVDDLGGLIIEELEESADEGEEVDFEKEVEPWLGERGAYIYPKIGGGDSDAFAMAVETTDSDAAEEFLNKQAEQADEEVTDESFEGVDFKLDEDGDTSGIIEGLLVIAEEEAVFKEVITASKEESLADESNYSDAISGIPDDSAANVFVDISGLIRAAEAEGEIDKEVKLLFENAGINLKDATAVASLVPGSDRIEIDVSSDAIEENVPSGDASELLGSLPADSFVAFAAPEFGKRFNEGLDQIDEQGIPDEGIAPGELKKSLKQAGIDLESIAGSIGDVGAFAQGSSESDLGGALVLTTEDATQAKNTVSNIGLFLRSANVPGITTIKDKVSGFSIRDPELGPQPVVVAAKGSRIAIGYGLAPTLAAFEEPGRTLADSPSYKEAVSALAETPITAFVAGPAALELASSLIPPGEEEFEAAEPYLQKIDYVAVGSEASGDLAIAKLIIGLK
jgi:hypothetical protein